MDENESKHISDRLNQFLSLTLEAEAGGRAVQVVFFRRILWKCLVDQRWHLASLVTPGSLLVARTSLFQEGETSARTSRWPQQVPGSSALLYK